MGGPAIPPARHALWQELGARAARVAGRPILSLFEGQDGAPGAATDGAAPRAEAFSVQAEGLLLDYAKTNLDAETRALLLDLAGAAGLEAAREAMFAGARINTTEARAALHVALRAQAGPICVEGHDVLPAISETRARMAALARDVRSGRFAGAGGPFSDVVNIGIGGSDLGPAVVLGALAPFADGPRVHFVSNIDGADLADTLARLDPARTLVIVSSKTFTTLETMANAEATRAWMAAHVPEPGAQFVAVCSAEARAQAFGIAPERVFGFGDYVGGRLSVWGPVGLAVMLAIGPERFEAFLAGGAAMDAHFRTAPLQANMPVMLALVGLWHRQFCGYPTRAVLPYAQRLKRFPAYLQQLEMESNGKRVDSHGQPLAHPSGPVVWGAAGTDAQHAFFQLLHQGTDIVPCEFIVVARGEEPGLEGHHRLLVANALAQSAALMRGRGPAQAARSAAAKEPDPARAAALAPHLECPGNRPSTTLVLPRLTPHVLGLLMALCEHRVFVEGVLLGINPFDQWGVELGKELARELAPHLGGTTPLTGLDPSTCRLLDALAAVPEREHDHDEGPDQASAPE